MTKTAMMIRRLGARELFHMLVGDGDAHADGNADEEEAAPESGSAVDDLDEIIDMVTGIMTVYV